MKILHVADIHIGTKFNKIDNENKKKYLIKSLNNCFGTVVEYAKQNNIKTILLSGDVFDKDRVLKKDKEYFYQIIKGNPSIDFYYLKGNHDISSGYNDEYDNLHTFNNDGMPVKYELEDEVVLYGYELSDDSNNSNLYNMSSLNANYYNILMLHGDVSSSAVDHKIDIDQLKNKNINYLALGHIHTYEHRNVGANTQLVYPGCLMGRGFDEIGEKGFVVFDTETNEHEFVPLKNKVFDVLKIDVTDIENLYLLEQHLKSKIEKDDNKILEVVLVGRREFDIDKDSLCQSLDDYVYYLSIKDKTKRKLSSYDDQDERSLKGMFIKTIKADKSIDDDEKEEILRYGLSKIEKGEI